MEKNNESFQLLSKLLTDREGEKNQVTNLFEYIYKTARQDLAQALNKSTYPYKTSLLNEFIDILTEIEILIQFPELIGKTIVGFRGEMTSNILNTISKEGKSEAYGNSNIPSIIYRGAKDGRINLVNLLDNSVDIGFDDYRRTNNLYRHGLDIRQFIQVFSISAQITHPNIVYVYFPFYAIKSQEYYINLLDLTDYILIPLETDESWKETYDFYTNKRPDKDLVFVGQGGPKGQEAKTIGLEALNQWLESQNLARNNLTFYERFLWIISKFNKEQKARLDYQSGLLSSINKNLIGLEEDDDETKVNLRDYRAEIIDLRESEKRSYDEFNRIGKELLNQVAELINYLLLITSEAVVQSSSSKILFNKGHEDLLAKLVINLIEIGDLTRTRYYIDRLKANDYPYAYILDLYNNNQKGMTLSPSLLTRLKEDKSHSNILYKAKVKFANNIGLTLYQAGEYAKALEEPLDGYENFQLGNYYVNRDMDKALFYYNKALDLGYQEAGLELVNYYSSSTFELKRLADKLIPEANYQYAMACFAENNKKMAVINLRIAASFGHEKAILELADMEYSILKYNSRNLDERGMKSVNIVFNLYGYLLKKNPSDTFLLERIGLVYFWIGDYSKAREFLSKCNSPQALYAYGRIYQYGDNGVPQDLNKAKSLFEKASNKGHEKAQVELEKVTGWIASNQERNTYNSDNVYSTRTVDTSYSHSEGCILTTATCQILGKEDDCEELTAFREYRDKHLIHDEGGPELIREYYRIAPKILEKIHKEENSSQIFQEMYTEGIAVGYELLKKGQYAKAKEVYYNMVKKLSTIYGVE